MDITIHKSLLAFIGVIAFLALEMLGHFSRKRQMPGIYKHWLYWFVQFFIVFIAIIIANAIAVEPPETALMVGFMVPAVVRKFAAQQARRVEDVELRESLKHAEKEVDEKPQQARPVWEVSRLQLEIYIRRNQVQVNSIFWITIFVMLVGFGLIGFGVYQAVTKQVLDAAILTTASGIITQFIGATFLFIYKSTMAQASNYVQTLEHINSVGMAVQILDSIPDEQIDLKNKARTDMVNKILGR